MEGTLTFLSFVLAIAVLLMLGMLLYLGFKLLRTLKYVRDPAMPAKGKWVFGLALLYAVSPVDLLPDPILIDDIGVVLLAVRSISNMARRVGILHSSSGRSHPVIDVRGDVQGLMPSAGGPMPGWYAAAGDPPGTQRYWDGRQWVGEPQPIENFS